MKSKIAIQAQVQPIVMLPCPFCGGEKIIFNAEQKPMVFCWTCGATMSWLTAKQTIDAWNKRV